MLHMIQRDHREPPIMYRDWPTPEMIAAAKLAGEAERHAVLTSARSGKEAMWLLRHFFPESAPALKAFFWASEEFGAATCEREFREQERQR